VKYVVAGYVICLSVLCAYAVSLWWRRRRLSRAVAVSEASVQERAGPGGER
jgi:preprotein translocase subunit Sec63